MDQLSHKTAIEAVAKGGKCPDTDCLRESSIKVDTSSFINHFFLSSEAKLGFSASIGVMTWRTTRRVCVQSNGFRIVKQLDSIIKLLRRSFADWSLTNCFAFRQIDITELSSLLTRVGTRGEIERTWFRQRILMLQTLLFLVCVAQLGFLKFRSKICSHKPRFCWCTPQKQNFCGKYVFFVEILLSGISRFSNLKNLFTHPRFRTERFYLPTNSSEVFNISSFILFRATFQKNTGMHQSIASAQNELKKFFLEASQKLHISLYELLFQSDKQHFCKGSFVTKSSQEVGFN